MKQRYLLVHLVAWSLFLQSGCQEKPGGAKEPGMATLTVPVAEFPEAAESGGAAPKLTFENVVHDFGTIGPGLKKAKQRFEKDGLMFRPWFRHFASRSGGRRRRAPR